MELHAMDEYGAIRELLRQVKIIMSKPSEAAFS